MVTWPHESEQNIIVSGVHGRKKNHLMEDRKQRRRKGLGTWHNLQRHNSACLLQLDFISESFQSPKITQSARTRCSKHKPVGVF